MEKKQFTEEMREKCKASFPDEAYSQHPTKTFLTTLKAMYVTERLNDVFGVGRWTIHTEVIERTEDYVLLQGEFESRDYDVTVPKQFGGHKTSGKNTEIADGFKSAFTDCMSKIASYFEIGLDMFKGKVNVNGKSPTQKKTTKKEAPDNEKPWLNKFTDKSKTTITENYAKVLKAMADGYTIKQVREKYKVSNDIAKLLEDDIDNHVENGNIKQEYTTK